ncbi:hypothetical protein ACFVAG_10435 [Streptomyces sp. NPDC057644]|uniref:hypothetical protein n=1 Tax=Streptomyces sp. NPDC057644 TaxID=3346191 RepID=UPI003677038C
MTEFSSTGWIALFSNHQANNEGWDSLTRIALVADAEIGVLEPVTDYPGFQRLAYAHKVIGATSAFPHRRSLRPLLLQAQGTGRHGCPAPCLELVPDRIHMCNLR